MPAVRPGGLAPLAQKMFTGIYHFAENLIERYGML